LLIITILCPVMWLDSLARNKESYQTSEHPTKLSICGCKGHSLI